MDYYKKYYRIGKDGTYSVHFPNKKGFSIEEIRDIFSLYGNVLSVNIAGNNYGLRFIRYRTLKETINCLKGLQNNDDIKILPQKDKICKAIKTTDERNPNQWQATRVDNLLQRISNNGEQLNSNFAQGEKFSAIKEKSIYDKSSNNINKPELVQITHSTSFSKCNKYNSDTLFKSDSVTSDKCSLLRKQQNSLDKVSSDDQVTNQEEIKCYSLKKSDLDICEKKDVFNDKIPALISQPGVKPKESDAMSDSSSTRTKHTLSKPIIILTQEVIVANIHKDYGVHYILHLFEKHNPIAATFVKTIPETSIRYCQIYFKTAQDTLIIEEKFDNFLLSGKNLIVLRKSQLVDEVTKQLPE